MAKVFKRGSMIRWMTPVLPYWFIASIATTGRNLYWVSEERERIRRMERRRKEGHSRRNEECLLCLCLFRSALNMLYPPSSYQDGSSNISKQFLLLIGENQIWRENNSRHIFHIWQPISMNTLSATPALGVGSYTDVWRLGYSYYANQRRTHFPLHWKHGFDCGNRREYYGKHRRAPNFCRVIRVSITFRTRNPWTSLLPMDFHTLLGRKRRGMIDL